ncbi:MAG: helix-turn-helix domain-containing protein [Elusimicrobia bacterium]|nr:helix-turn-helix domain-containing protein [Elusimicrobiota bacterium]
MTEPTPARAAGSDDVGSVLKEARLRKGQTVETVFQHTRIPKKFIEALEANQFDVFPARVYLQGFLKNYCDHLDVEFDGLWRKINPPKSSDDKTEHAPPPAPTPAPKPAAAAPAPAPRLEPAKKAGQAAQPPAAARQPVKSAPAPVTPPPHEVDEPSGNGASWAPLVLVLLLVGGGIGWFMMRPKPAAPPPPVHVPPAIAPIKTHEKMALKVSFKKESWIRLKTDGHLRFEGRVPAGFSQQWNAMSDFVLRAKEPGDLAVTLDGKDLPLTPAMRDAEGDYKIVRP